MKAYFAVGDATTAIRMLAGHRALISYAYVGTPWVPIQHLPKLVEVTTDLMIDSGAFTAWKQERPIVLDDYVAWLLEDAPAHSLAISLDIIGDADASVANWERIRSEAPSLASKLMPVWHEGDPVEHLDDYVRHAPVVGLGRVEGRRSEQKTLEFYDAAFNRCPDAAFHALGNANPEQLEHYPMASFDSTGWQRDAGYSAAKPWPLNRVPRDLRMACYIEATETIEYKPGTKTLKQASLWDVVGRT